MARYNRLLPSELPTWQSNCCTMGITRTSDYAVESPLPHLVTSCNLFILNCTFFVLLLVHSFSEMICWMVWHLYRALNCLERRKTHFVLSRNTDSALKNNRPLAKNISVCQTVLLSGPVTQCSLILQCDYHHWSWLIVIGCQCIFHNGMSINWPCSKG